MRVLVRDAGDRPRTGVGPRPGSVGGLPPLRNTRFRRVVNLGQQPQPLLAPARAFVVLRWLARTVWMAMATAVAPGRPFTQPAGQPVLAASARRAKTLPWDGYSARPRRAGIHACAPRAAPASDGPARRTRTIGETATTPRP
ncbi:MAG: hypothetical protein ACI9K2_004771 [Myxococcota bacterium]|jgi:hypothetical protein